MDIERAIGARMRALRLNRGIGLREMARRVGCDPSGLLKREHGRIAWTATDLYAVGRELGLRSLVAEWAAP